MVPIGMERFTASKNPTVDECQQQARECEIYLGIVAHRYGWIPDGYEVSITELEYNAAKEAGRPRLMFELEPGPIDQDKDFDPEPDRQEKQKKLIAFKATYQADQMPARFNNMTLGAQVLQALIKNRVPNTRLYGVPRGRSTVFVGRDEELKSLENMLSNQSYVRLAASIEGLAEIGKTELALQLAYKLKHGEKFPGGIYWLDASDPDLTPIWGTAISDDYGGIPDGSAEERSQKLLHRLSTNKDPLLIVLDNVEKGKGTPRPVPCLEVLMYAS